MSEQEPASPMLMAQIDAIDVVNRMRPSDPARVEALAASINEIGLQQPIIVRMAPDDSNRMVLVAGGHRLAVAKLLGWAEIPAILLDIDEAEARLVEIDENLIRNELTELDRALALAERKRIYEALHPETKHGGRRPKRVSDQVANLATWMRYSKDAARKTGMSERAVQRATELAGALTPQTIAALRGTKVADNQAQLQALAALPEEQQVSVAGLIGTGAANTVTKAREIAGFVPAGGTVRPEDAQLKRLEAALLRLDERQLRDLRAMVDARLAALEPAPKPRKGKSGSAA